jgi:hypothetical protein
MRYIVWYAAAAVVVVVLDVIVVASFNFIINNCNCFCKLALTLVETPY